MKPERSRALHSRWVLATAVIGLGFIFTGVVCAERGPLPKEAQDLNAKAVALTSYRTAFVLETKEEDGQTVRLEGKLSFQMPNRRRLEIHEGGSKDLAQSIVSDGQKEWHYYPATKSLYRVNAPKEIPGPQRPFGEMEPGTVRFVERRGSGPTARLRFEGKPAASITEGAPAPIETIRVDVGEDGLVRELYLLSQKGEQVFSQIYSEVEVNVSLPPSDFLFTPPAGVPIIEMGASPDQTESSSRK